MKYYYGRQGTRVRLTAPIERLCGFPVTNICLQPEGAEGVIVNVARRFPGSIEMTYIRFGDGSEYGVHVGNYERATKAKPMKAHDSHTIGGEGQ